MSWGLGEGFGSQTRTSIVLGGVLAVLAAVGLAAIIAIRF